MESRKIDPREPEIQEVQAAEESKLLDMPNVVGMGVGSKVTEGVDTGEACLTVFVSQKLTDPDDLRAEDKIESSIAGVPTDVVETGEIFALAELMEPYRHCHLVWCQEEPRNMGAWATTGPFIHEVAEQLGSAHPVPRYAGRPTAASPATGSAPVHRAQQAALLDEALTVGLEALPRIASRRDAAERREGDGS